MAEETTFPTLDFAAQAANLEKRRELARSLIQRGIAQNNSGAGYHGGRVYIVGNPLGDTLGGIAGAYMDDKAAGEQQALQQQEQAAAQQLIQRLGTPGMKEQMGPAENGGPMPQGPLSAEEESARRLGVISEGMGIPSLRQTLQAQLGQELDYPRQREQEAQKLAMQQAALEAQDKRQAAQFAHQLAAIDARLAGQKELKQMPTVQIYQGGGGGKGGIKAPSGYRYNEDGTALEPIPGGPHDPNAKPTKPVNLTAAQQKAVDDSDALLGYIEDAQGLLKQNPNAIGMKTIMPDMALSKIDPEGVATRAAIGGLSAERVHQLSGAAVSPAEFARLRPYLPASGDTADAVAKKLDGLKREVTRIREAHMKGPTRAQPNAIVQQQPTAERKTIGGKSYVKRNGEWYAE